MCRCCAVWFRTFVCRSKVSFSCRCFPVLLARSIHLPLNHLMVGLRRRSLASTLAMKVMSPPLTHIESTVLECHRASESLRQFNFNDIRGMLIGLALLLALFCTENSPTATVALWGFSMSRVDSGGVSMGLSSSSGGWPSPRDHTAQ